MASKRLYIPIAILSTVMGFALFLVLALQAGIISRPVVLPFDSSVSASETSTIPGIGTITRMNVSSVPITEEPSRIVIPRLGVDAAIEHVGINKKGEVGIPVKFENTAWFNQSVKPGEAGNAIIDGHVNDRLSRPAVFADLKQLVSGDFIVVYYPSGAAYAFAVDTNTSYALKDVPMNDLLAPAPISKLNLITCTGTWIQDVRMYDERLVVTTHLVGIVQQESAI